MSDSIPTSHPVRALGARLASDGKVDREDARKLISEIVKDGVITEDERKALDHVDTDHRVAVWQGGTTETLWSVFSGAIADPSLLRGAVEAERSGGRISVAELKLLNESLAADGVVTSSESASFRYLAFGGFRVTEAARREFRTNSAVVHPENRSDLSLIDSDPLRDLHQEVAESGEVTTLADDGWTERTFKVPAPVAPAGDDADDVDDVDDSAPAESANSDAAANDEPKTVDVIAKRKFDNAGRITELSTNDPRQMPALSVRRYAYDDFGKLSRVTMGSGGNRKEIDIKYDDRGRVKQEVSTKHRDGNSALIITANHKHDAQTGRTSTEIVGALDSRWPQADTVPEGYPVGKITAERRSVDASGLRRTTEVESTPQHPSQSMRSMVPDRLPSTFFPLPSQYSTGEKTHDASGRVIRVVAKKKTFDIKYDDNGRISQIDERGYPKTPNDKPPTSRFRRTYTYDDTGRPLNDTWTSLKSDGTVNKEKSAHRKYAADGTQTVERFVGKTRTEWTTYDADQRALDRKTARNDGGVGSHEVFTYVGERIATIESTITPSDDIATIERDTFTKSGDGFEHRYEESHRFGKKVDLVHRTTEQMRADEFVTSRRIESLGPPVLFQADNRTASGGEEPGNLQASIVVEETYRYGETLADGEPKLLASSRHATERVFTADETVKLPAA